MGKGVRGARDAWAVFGLALALRLTAGLAWGGLTNPALFEPDTIARSLLAGDGFVFVWHGGVVYHSFLAPLYPSICAAMYWIGGGSVVPLMMLQITVSSFTAALMAHIGARLFSRRAALAVGVLTAVHPGLIFNATSNVHELTFDALAFAAIFWAWIRLREQLTWRRAAWVGIIGGLSLLERPTTVVFLVAGSIWLWWKAAHIDRRATIHRIGLAAVCAGLVITPWTIRNASLQDRFVFIRSTDWEVFWRGNNPQATGHSYTPSGQTVLSTLPAEAMTELQSLPDENQQGDWFRDRAFEYILEQPGTFAAMTLKKWYYFWWFSPQTGTLYPRWWLYLYLSYYSPVLAFALVGIYTVSWRKRGEQSDVVQLLVPMLLALSLLQSLYYVEGRHRWAVEPLLLLLTGVGLAWATWGRRSVTSQALAPKAPAR